MVDDNASSLATLCETLESFGVACRAEADGELAIDEFVRASSAARGGTLVLVDWSLPGMTGLDVIRRMREHAPSSSAEFIMIGSDSLPDAEQRIRDAHIAGVVPKPATPSFLLEAILRGLGKLPAAADGMASRPAAEKAWQAEGRHVLLIEDNDVNRLIAGEFLKAAGVRVTTASSAHEAIDLVASGERFDLLFMDIQMADMDGIEATRVLRAMQGGADLVIVALTAHALPGDRARCLAAGMDDYLSKPLSPEALHGCLHRWLSLV